MIKKAYRYFKRKCANVFACSHAITDSSIASVSGEIIEEYNKTRDTGNRKLICYAPFKNIYFNIQGDTAPCWLTFKDPDSYPEKTIHEIWFGEKFTELREKIKNCDLTGKCSVCNHYINSGNYVTPLAKAYDNDYPDQCYPVMMELELANTCNLECVMCNGKLSSSVRKNREKLEPFQIPYDEQFVKQLDEFLPHLSEARFNGGEPFLNEIYYQIWEKILEVKPSMKIVIATNGTVMNDKVKNILGKGRFDINLSCDSLDRATYESIRVNASFERTMENLKWFHDYCKRKNSTLCILTNPMRQNWHEMPDFIHFCNERNLPIWFNTIHRPYEFALWTLSSEKLNEIYLHLSAFKFDVNPLKLQTYHNQKIYHNLVYGQIKTWIKEAEDRELNKIIPADHQVKQKIRVDDPVAFFYESLNNYFLSMQVMEQIKMDKATELTNKFNQVRKIITLEIPENEFFEKIIRVPVENIVTDLEKENIDSLVAKSRKLYFSSQ